ncbi:immunoglobulin domain-containing protein, partial [Olleya namhaensis]|uniref:leucine-rich repeat domain-containing protein n=1 Tax=Olleya namhaensis TaxID=1144750 RepID=UPI00232A90DF
MYSTKKIKLYLTIGTLFISTVLFAQVTPAEKTALQAVYNALDGPNWNSQNDADTSDDWDFTQPVTSAWYGISLIGSNITELQLSHFNDQNNLSGVIPPEIGDFPALTNLEIEYADLTGTTIPLEIGNLTALEVLELGYNSLDGPLPLTLGNLTSLKQLIIDHNSALTGAIPIEIGNLLDLERLSFSDNNLSGDIPSEITQLTKLISLGLDRNQFTGAIPVDIGNLVELEYLTLWDNPTLSGPLPTSIGNLVSLISLDISDTAVNGSIPNTVSGMIKLQRFQMSNCQLSGNIPGEFGVLPVLSWLRLYNNQLSGNIPPGLGNSNSINRINLLQNQLSGNIPAELGNIQSLEVLNLSSNQLTGNIPAEIGNISSLVSLNLYDNQLTDLPWQLSNLNNLRFANLGNNQINGSIPIEFGNFTSLQKLEINNNLLSGNIPSELGNILTLRELRLENNQLDGSTPITLTNLVNLEKIRIGNNQLSGSIPDFTTLNLSSLYINENEFQFGDFENEFNFYDTSISFFDDNPQAKVDNIETRNLNTGDNTTITTTCSGTQNNYKWFKNGTTEIVGETNATLLLNNLQPTDAGIYHCEVTSDIITDLTILRHEVTINVANPPCTISQSEIDALLALYSSTNGAIWTSETDGDTTNDWDLANPIEDWFGLTIDCVLGTVTKIELLQSNTIGNNLVGILPMKIGDFTNLLVLDLGGNTISGNIIPEVYNLTALTNLSLNDNQFTGDISSQIGNLTSLSNLELDDNLLTGAIPVEIGNLTDLYRVWLYSNQLTGTIPIELGNLSNLNQLYLYNNQLTGSIPNELTNIPDLDWLLLQNNNFSGTIPSFTYNLTMIWFSFNSNAFQFGDFENDFNWYNVEPNVFWDSPQAKVDAIETRNLNLGNNTTMVTNCSGSQNNYQWYKNNTPLNDTGTFSGTQTATLTLTNVQFTDTGTYHCEVTSDIVTDLTIERNDITLNVTTASYSINYMSTVNGAIVGDGTDNTNYFGPNDYGDYGNCTSGNWRWIHALCSECLINNKDVSVKQNNANGSTWFAGGGASRYMVIDLSMPRTFNELRVFQMFSDGKVTSLRMYSHLDTATVPFYSDAGWIPIFTETSIGAGVITGDTVSMPTIINFPYTTSRFLLIEAKNDGSLGNAPFTEIRELKLFDTNSVTPAPIDAIETPAFTQVDAICEGEALSALPTTSNNGITGTWSPTLNTTATTEYTFTPNLGQCATTNTMTITVNPAPSEPTGLECWESNTWDATSCAWITSGTQATEPTGLECWETNSWNTTSCSWVTSGTQPNEPTGLECWEINTWDATSCSWITSGTQPNEPTGLECWETNTWDAISCSWITSGTQPNEPTGLACWETNTWDATSCSWITSGTQPNEPTGLACWESNTWDVTSCTWITSGTQPNEP